MEKGLHGEVKRDTRKGDIYEEETTWRRARLCTKREHQGVTIFGEADSGNPPIADLTAKILGNVSMWM